MDPFTGALLIAWAIVATFRSGVRHARDDYQRTSEAGPKKPKVPKDGKAPTIAAGKKLKRANKRRHRAGWWASEIGHGFPVTRTGLHAGWLAHKAAAVQTKAQREEARTQHLDVTASYVAVARDHRKRQQAAQRDIEAALAESGVVQDGKRKTVRRTVDEVAAKRAEKAKAYNPAAMDRAWDENWRIGDRRAPDRDARQPEPGPFAPKDDGPYCGACGHPGTPGDPLIEVASARVPIHYSHVTDPESGFHGETVTSPACTACGKLLRLREHDGRDHVDCAPECTECGDPLSLRASDGWAHDDCDRVSNAEADACEVRDGRDPEIVEAELIENGRCPYQTAYGDGGRPAYCGRGITDTGGDEPDEYCLEHDCTVNGDEAGAIQERNERVAELLYRDRHDLTAHSTTTEGDTMSGDTTFSTVKTSATAAIGLADQDTASIRGRKDRAFALADEMVALDVDPAVVSEQMAHAEALRDAEEALARAGEHATATSTQLDRYHAGMEEATVNAPGSVAAREFHGE